MLSRLHFRVVGGTFLALVHFLWMTPGSAWAEAIVYDNKTTILNIFHGIADGWICGDEVTLAGTERIAKRLDVIFYSNASVTADTKVTLYANDGAGGSPSSVLYSSIPESVDYGGLTTFSADLPSTLVLPDTLTWTVSLSNRNPSTGVDVGPLLYNPPTTGSSGDYFWEDENDGLGFRAYWFGGPPYVANFGATLVADVPEPATVSLLCGGLLALGLFLRQGKGD